MIFRILRFSLLVAAAAFCAVNVCYSAITIPGADGSDSVFNPTANVEVDLSQAATGNWDAASPVAGKGIYDPEKWAVVFKYTDVNIPAGVSVTFKNHPSHAPVVWLVSGNITTSGSIILSGAHSANSGLTPEAGPGGFRGGAGRTILARSAAFGPGAGAGGANSTAGGSYGTFGGAYNGGTVGPTYGNPQILPLIGGSGALGKGDSSSDGGAGGGAILIACANTIRTTMSGAGIRCQGGNGESGGSGGAIRLIANDLSLDSGSVLSAQGGGGYYGASGGSGRIRIETPYPLGLKGNIAPVPSVGITSSPALVWPPDGTPSVKVVQIGGVTVPADPHASLGIDHDVKLATTGKTKVQLEALNVPTTWTVVVRLAPRHGEAVTANAVMVSGDNTASVWEAEMDIPEGLAVIQARAYKP